MILTDLPFQPDAGAGFAELYGKIENGFAEGSNQSLPAHTPQIFADFYHNEMVGLVFSVKAVAAFPIASGKTGLFINDLHMDPHRQASMY